MQQQQRWFSWLWQRKQPAAIVRIGPTVRSGRNGCLICRNFSGYFNELLVDVGLFHKLTSFQCCCAKFSSDHLCSNVSGIFLFLKTSPCVHFFSTCTDLAALWAYPKPSLKLFFLVQNVVLLDSVQLYGSDNFDDEFCRVFTCRFRVWLFWVYNVVKAGL